MTMSPDNESPEQNQYKIAEELEQFGDKLERLRDKLISINDRLERNDSRG